MKGTQKVKVSNRYGKYEFELFRNITIIRGESGTGKTTLYNMIADYTRDKDKSGVSISSTSTCVALTDTDWKNQLNNTSESIVFIDEDSKYITSVDFAEAVKKSNNYYVIFNREGLHNLPYSVNEIYEIKTSGKYHKLKKCYPLNSKNEYIVNKKKNVADTVLTEDSKSGFQFFNVIASEHNLACESTGSNSAIFSWIKTHPDKKAIIICDGAAFGSEIDRVSKLLESLRCGRLILPESFEWIILKSGIVDNVREILDAPAEHIESSMYFSWENYFTKLLIDRTKDSFLAYSKNKLNDCYLHDFEKHSILAIIPDIY